MGTITARSIRRAGPNYKGRATMGTILRKLVRNPTARVFGRHGDCFVCTGSARVGERTLMTFGHPTKANRRKEVVHSRSGATKKRSVATRCAILSFIEKAA